ncbi:MAG: DUF362 domain-containing protein [Nitrospinae bacterium]|nr:DUF362 domain-containing protein [Nitrospinota bacterium]
MNKVAIQKQWDYQSEEIIQKVDAAVNSLGGFQEIFGSGKRVLLKPNLLGAFPPEKCVTTHPEIVRAVIHYLKAHSCKTFIGDSPAVQGMQSCMKKSGILEVAKETDTELIEFKEGALIPISEEFKFKKVNLAKEIFDFDHIVNLPKLKGHSMMVLTLAIKNLFGCVVGKRKAQWHLHAGRDYPAFGEMLVEIASIVNPTLNILDGVWGMEGNGPSSGDPIHTGVLITGRDAFAVDVAVCQMLGYDPNILFTNQAALKIGMTLKDYFDVDYSILTPNEVKIDKFALPTTHEAHYGLSGDQNPTFGNKVKGFILSGLLKSAEGLMSTKPVVNHTDCTLCNFCAKACPPEVISEENKKIKINYDDCIRCYCCHEVCPEDAMGIQDSFLKRYAGIG